MVALKFGEDFFLGGGEGLCGPQSWEGTMAVVCGEVFGWAERFLTKMSNIRLEWGIE